MWDVWRPAPPGWIFHCPWCFAGIYRYTWSAAFADAIEHVTEEPCDGLRLAWLLRELEALRDSRVNMQPTDLVTWGIKSEDHCRGWAAAQRQAAADLTALLGRLG